MLDSNLLLVNSAANVVATVKGVGKEIGQSLVPESWMAFVPNFTGTSPTLVITIQASNTDVDATYETVGTMTVTALGQYFTTVVSNKPWRRAVLTVGGTTPDCGKVIVGRVPAGRYKAW